MMKQQRPRSVRGAVGAVGAGTQVSASPRPVRRRLPKAQAGGAEWLSLWFAWWNSRVSPDDAPTETADAPAVDAPSLVGNPSLGEHDAVLVAAGHHFYDMLNSNAPNINEDAVLGNVPVYRLHTMFELILYAVLTDFATKVATARDAPLRDAELEEMVKQIETQMLSVDVNDDPDANLLAHLKAMNAHFDAQTGTGGGKPRRAKKTKKRGGALGTDIAGNANLDVLGQLDTGAQYLEETVGLTYANLDFDKTLGKLTKADVDNLSTVKGLVDTDPRMHAMSVSLLLTHLRGIPRWMDLTGGRTTAPNTEVTAYTKERVTAFINSVNPVAVARNVALPKFDDAAKKFARDVVALVEERKKCIRLFLTPEWCKKSIVFMLRQKSAFAQHVFDANGASSALPRSVPVPVLAPDSEPMDFTQFVQAHEPRFVTMRAHGGSRTRRRKPASSV